MLGDAADLVQLLAAGQIGWGLTTGRERLLLGRAARKLYEELECVLAISEASKKEQTKAPLRDYRDWCDRRAAALGQLVPSRPLTGSGWAQWRSWHLLRLLPGDDGQARWLRAKQAYKAVLEACGMEAPGQGPYGGEPSGLEMI